MLSLGQGFIFLCKRERLFAYLAVALTVLACWLLILLEGDRVKSADEPDFMDIARNLAFHGVFAETEEPTAYRAPGLVFFLAPLVRAGAGLVEARLANALLVGLTLLMIFHLVRRHAPAPAGLFAVVMIPLWPVVIYTATTIYPQTLGAFLLVLTVFLIDRIGGRPGTRGAVLPALAYGAMILTIPVTLLLLPFFLLWILWQSAHRWPQIVTFCLISGLVVGSWTLRNYVTFNAFIPVATSSGYNLMAGNAPNARYDTSVNVTYPDYVYTELTGADEIETNRILTRAALRQIIENPGRTARLYGAKFLHWFEYSNALLSDQVIEGGASSVRADLRDVILLVTYIAVIAGPLVLRILMIRRYPMTPFEIFCLVLWVGAGLAYALFFTRIRFRMPFDWLIISTNAIFLAALCENFLRNRGLLAGRAA